MMVLRQPELTPCGVLFDVFKRRGGISHKELAGLILSDRPLSDGRSASSRAADRTWLSHFIVHAPVESLQPAYFRDWGLSAQRIMSRLRQYGSRSTGCSAAARSMRWRSASSAGTTAMA